MRKKIISGGRNLYAVFFFFLEMKFCFQTLLKYFFFQEDGVQSSIAKLQSLRACFGDILQSFTVILIAVKNHTDITYKELKKRAYVHAQSAQSCFSILLIHNVVFHNSTLLTAALLLHLSDPSIVNKTSREPLIWACTKTTNKLVKY